MGALAIQTLEDSFTSVLLVIFLTAAGACSFSAAVCLCMPVPMAVEASHGVRDIRADWQVKVFYSNPCWWSRAVKCQNPCVGLNDAVSATNGDPSCLDNSIQFRHHFFLGTTYQVSALDHTLRSVESLVSLNSDWCAAETSAFHQVNALSPSMNLNHEASRPKSGYCLR